jgi:hypothetical protein
MQPQTLRVLLRYAINTGAQNQDPAPGVNRPQIADQGRTGPKPDLRSRRHWRDGLGRRDLRAVLDMKFKSDDCGGKYTASQTCGDSTIDIERMPIDEG